MFELTRAAVSLPGSRDLVNFYVEAESDDDAYETTAWERVAALDDHIASTAGGGLVLVGEAAGWRGARQSGVAFTDASLVGRHGTKEQSARAVRSTLAELGLLAETLLWNAVTLHPHRPNEPQSNRTPSKPELQRGLPALELAIIDRMIVCVGAKAADAVGTVLGIDVPLVDVASLSAPAVQIRHPSYGGAPEFRRGLRIAAGRFYAGQ